MRSNIPGMRIALVSRKSKSGKLRTAAFLHDNCRAVSVALHRVEALERDALGEMQIAVAVLNPVPQGPAQAFGKDQSHSDCALCRSSKQKYPTVVVIGTARDVLIRPLDAKAPLAGPSQKHLPSANVRL
jgi:hypothetical protein